MDGFSIYGRYTNEGTSARGVRIPLDACGGHTHEVTGLDESGNTTTATEYHYHSAVETGLRDTLEGTPGGPYLFNAFKLGPDACWRGDIGSVSNFWDSDSTRTAVRRDVLQDSAEGGRFFKPLDKAVDYEELRPCCGMVHYYLHASLRQATDGDGDRGDVTDGAWIEGWGRNAPHPPSIPPMPLPPSAPSPPSPPPDETGILVIVGASSGAGLAGLVICFFFVYLYRRYDGTDQWRGGMGPEPALGLRWTRLEGKPTEALGLSWTQVNGRPKGGREYRELNKYHPGTIKLREALEAGIKANFASAGKEMVAHVQAAKDGTAGKTSLASVAAAASRARKKDTEEVIVKFSREEVDAFALRNLKWDSFVEARGAKGTIVWFVPTPDPNELRHTKLRKFLEMGLTKLDQREFDKLGLDRAMLTHDSWIEVDLERNFIKQKAYFKPKPKLPPPKPVSDAAAKRLEQKEQKERKGRPAKDGGKVDSRQQQQSTFTPPGLSRGARWQGETQDWDLSQPEMDEEAYWPKEEADWTQKQAYLKHNEWRMNHAEQQPPPHSSWRAHEWGPPPPSAVAAGAAILANWRHGPPRPATPQSRSRQAWRQEHPMMTPQDEQDEHFSSAYWQSPYQGMRAPYRV